MRHIGWITGSAMSAVNIVVFAVWHQPINLYAAIFCAAIALVSLLTTRSL